MDIPHNAFVMVADGRKMLLFRNEGDERYPNLQVVTHDEKFIPATEDFGTDEPGSTFSGSRGTGPVGAVQAGAENRSGYENTDFHQLEEDRFAADAAEELKRRALANEYDALIVVAPPKTLGQMRRHYHKEVQSRLVGEIAKDIAQMPTQEIERVIQQN